MYDDALSFPLLGTQAYAYGAMLMLGCWLGIGLLVVLSRKSSQPGLFKASAVTAAFALPLGFVLARLAYCLLDPGFHPFLSLANVLDVRAGGFSMYGALIGAALAAILGAKAAGVRPLALMDLTAPALAAFLIPARLGEGYTALGISRPLTSPWLIDSFLARRDEYDAYLRTYVLEAFIALVLLVSLLWALRRIKKTGLVFTAFCLWYGITQTLMESLRYDGHLRYSFVGVSQVLSAALFSITLIVLALRALRQKTGGRWLPILTLAAVPLVLGAAIGVEFLIDRSEMGKLTSYALYVLLLALPAVLGTLLINREEHLWRNQSSTASTSWPARKRPKA